MRWPKRQKELGAPGLGAVYHDGEHLVLQAGGDVLVHRRVPVEVGGILRGGRRQRERHAVGHLVRHRVTSWTQCAPIIGRAVCRCP